MSSRDPKTHQTTIRFSPSQWRALEEAAGKRDMSVAQYVREAARTRLEADTDSVSGELHDAVAKGIDAREKSFAEAESSVALWEQGRRARERAQDLREQSRQKRRSAGRRPARPLPEPSEAAAIWEQGGVARERARMLHDHAREGRMPDRSS